METAYSSKDALASRIEAYRVDKMFVRQVGDVLKREADAGSLVRESIQRLIKAGVVESEEGESVASYIAIGRAEKLLTDEESAQLLAVAHRSKANLLRQKADDFPFTREYFMAQAKHHDRRLGVLLDLLETLTSGTQELAVQVQDQQIDNVIAEPAVETIHQENEVPEIEPFTAVEDTTVEEVSPNGADVEPRHEEPQISEPEPSKKKWWSMF